MGVMFYLSSQPGDLSATVSRTVLTYGIGSFRFNRFFNGATVRDAAHVCEYAVLGVLAYLNFSQYKEKGLLLLSFIFCFCFAISDEIHQHFTPGRAIEAFDILLDSCGSLIGIFVIHFVNLVFRKKKDVNHES